MKGNFNRTIQSVFAYLSGKGVSARSFYRNRELLVLGAPVCARVTAENSVWLVQLFSVEAF